MGRFKALTRRLRGVDSTEKESQIEDTLSDKDNSRTEKISTGQDGTPAAYTTAEPSASNKWCSICGWLRPDVAIPQWLDSGGFGNLLEIVSKLSAIQEALCNGCVMCSLLYRAIAALEPDPADGLFVIEVQADEISIQRRGKGKSRRKIYIHAASTVPPPWPTLKTAPDYEFLDLDFGYQQFFDLIKTWLNCCETQHQHRHCQLEAKQKLPHRVLDVGLDADVDTIYLVETSGQEADRYVALSHCWGRDTHFTTTLSTLEAKKRGMKLTTLPLAFYDAVTFTRKLGLRYLWIDSLCIVQDSSADWEVESAQMCDVYANSYITVLASSADGNTKSFIGQRPWQYKGTNIDYEQGSGKGDVLVHYGLHYDWERRGINSYSRTYGGPLVSRAWAYQEHLLSRRTVSYYDQELVWECGSLHCGDMGILAEEEKRLGMLISKPLVSSFSVTLTRLHEEWRWIVAEYSKRLLTEPQDRLPALSGLAAYFQKRLSESGISELKYLAGLWQVDLQHGLFWERNPQKELDFKVPFYLAPSWSWVSVEAPVIYRPVLNFRAAFDVLQTECSIDGLNKFGKLKDGSVKVSSLVQHCTVIKLRDFALGGETLQTESFQLIYKGVQTGNNTTVDYGPGGAINRRGRISKFDGHNVAYHSFDFYPDTVLRRLLVADETGAITPVAERATVEALAYSAETEAPWEPISDFVDWDDAGVICLLAKAERVMDHDRLDGEIDQTLFLLALAPCSGVAGAYERVGLGVLETTNMAILKLMATAVRKEITIV